MPGLWKIVVNDPVELVAISSKMYSVLTAEDVSEARECERMRAIGLDPDDPQDRMRALGLDPDDSENGYIQKKKGELMKKGKGVGRGVLEKLQHEHYRQAILESNKIFQVRMRGIRANRTKLSRVEIRKIGFHALDTKRFILRGGIQTLAFGHYRIPEIVREESMLEDDIDFEDVTVEEIDFNKPKKAKYEPMDIEEIDLTISDDDDEQMN